VLVAAASSAAAAGSGPGQSTADPMATPSSAKIVTFPSARVRGGGALEHRVDVLSKALRLDARQRAELLTILGNQREAVAKIWHNPAILPAERTPATRAAEERTADQIRAILSDEQKKRYNPPKPKGAEPPAPNVADWMQQQTRLHL
jgi:hypothetical protein